MGNCILKPAIAIRAVLARGCRRGFKGDNMTQALTLTQSQTKSFMVRTYAWMAFALFISAAAAYLTAQNMFTLSPDGRMALSSFGQLLFGGRGLGFIVLCVLEIAIVVILSATIRKISVWAATAFFILYAVVNGLTLSSIFVVYKISSIFSAFLTTSLTFLAMCIYGSKTKKDLTKFGRYLVMALMGIIIASVIQFVLGLITGAPLAMMDLIISVATVIVFTGLTAWDSQKIVQTAAYAKDNDDYKKVAIIGALELYLDFINIFLALLRIFGKNRD